MDAGWTKWVLERYGFEFASLTTADITPATLKDRIDVLLIGDEARGILPGGGFGRPAGADRGRRGARSRRWTRSFAPAERWSR